MRKLASIRRIGEIRPIPDADRICAYRVDGWWCVDLVGKYQVGDRVIYCEIDSWIPHAIAPFLSRGRDPRVHQGVPGERLRTVTLRGQISEGLLLPVGDVDAEDGEDVSDRLGVVKWEPVIPLCLQGQMKGGFPSFIRRTDEERLENLPDVLQDTDAEYEVTLKLDGSSMTVYHHNGEVGVCSRNLEFKLDGGGNAYVATARKTGLLDGLARLGRNIAVQGELMGPGIQGNRESLRDYQMFIFGIWDIDAQRYLGHVERLDVLTVMVAGGLVAGHAPVLHARARLPDLGIASLADAKRFVDRPSLHHPIAEGCVFKCMDGSASFKCVNTTFLLGER